MCNQKEAITAAKALALIHFAEEAGDYLHVGRRIGWYEEIITTTGTAEQKIEFDEIRSRHRAADEHMKIHGPDSLFNRDHPFIQKLERARKRIESRRAILPTTSV